jgi:hypothetical protein
LCCCGLIMPAAGRSATCTAQFPNSQWGIITVADQEL